MVQTLKRVYLYTAATFALLFTAAITIFLLDTLLNVAGMVAQYLDFNGAVLSSNPPPDSQTVTQNWILFLVTVVLVGGLFGGGHYWLIRRDARSDPGADAGVVRHLYLNLLLALAALVGVPTALGFLGGIDPTEGYHDQALSLSFLLVAGLVFLFIYLERRRVDPAGRAATLIRQIQEDGVQAILLVIASVVLYSSITTVVTAILVTNHVSTVNVSCATISSDGSVSNLCPGAPPLLSPILTAIFAIVAWGGYAWLGFWSQRAVLKRVLWYAALGYGLIWLLYGLTQAAYTGFATLFGDNFAWQEALLNSLPFVGQLLVGALILVPYALWLQRLGIRVPTLRAAVQQGMLALAATISIGFFLGGIILLLTGLVDQLVPSGNRLDADGWGTAVGVLVGGLIYPFFWLWLRRLSDPALGGPTAPRRVYVLVALAGTAIGALIAAVFMVYQILANVLLLASASPESARDSAVIFGVLGVAALAHLWQLRADLRAMHARAPLAQPAPVIGLAVTSLRSESAPLPEQPTETASAAETLEAILQRVAAGTLDPTSAAVLIRGLPKL